MAEEETQQPPQHLIVTHTDDQGTRSHAEIQIGPEGSQILTRNPVDATAAENIIAATTTQDLERFGIPEDEINAFVRINITHGHVIQPNYFLGRESDTEHDVDLFIDAIEHFVDLAPASYVDRLVQADAALAMPDDIEKFFLLHGLKLEDDFDGTRWREHIDNMLVRSYAVAGYLLEQFVDEEIEDVGTILSRLKPLTQGEKELLLREQIERFARLASIEDGDDVDEETLHMSELASKVISKMNQLIHLLEEFDAEHESLVIEQIDVPTDVLAQRLFNDSEARYTQAMSIIFDAFEDTASDRTLEKALKKQSYGPTTAPKKRGSLDVNHEVVFSGLDRDEAAVVAQVATCLEAFLEDKGFSPQTAARKTQKLLEQESVAADSFESVIEQLGEHGQTFSTFEETRPLSTALSIIKKYWDPSSDNRGIATILRSQGYSHTANMLKTLFE